MVKVSRRPSCKVASITAILLDIALERSPSVGPSAHRQAICADRCRWRCRLQLHLDQLEELPRVLVTAAEQRPGRFRGSRATCISGSTIDATILSCSGRGADATERMSRAIFPDSIIALRRGLMMPKLVFETTT